MAFRTRSSNQEYDQILLERTGGTVIRLEDYIDQYEPIKHKCLVCGDEKTASPRNFKRNTGCQKCRSIAKRIEREKAYHEKIGEIYDNDIVLLEAYIDNSTEATHKHISCGTEWRDMPQRLINGDGCPKCDRKTKWNNEEYQSILDEKFNGNILLIGDYLGHKEVFTHYCNECSEPFDGQPSNLLNSKSGCPKCSYRKMAQDKLKTHGQYVDDLRKKGILDIVPVEPYKGSFIEIKHRLVECGHEWDKQPVSIISGTMCPKCSGFKGEIAIERFMSNNGIDYKMHHWFDDCRNVRPLPFDCAVLNEDKSIRMLIEYDGRQHDEVIEYMGGIKDFERRKVNDRIKDEYCIRKEIRLIRIKHWEFDNIETILEEALGLVIA